MMIKPEYRAVLGGRCEQLEYSLTALSDAALTEQQRFHLNEIVAVLTGEEAEEEP